MLYPLKFTPILKERILNSLYGASAYDALTKSDVDELINAFNKLQEEIENE